MAKLTAKKRKAIPTSEFGIPGKRKFPMPDKNHAANAKSRATQGVKNGTLSSSEKKTIDAKANKILGKGKKEEPKPKHSVNAHRTLRGIRK